VRPWKLLGLAGLAGVAATGAVLVRKERQRRSYTPEDVRTRLQERYAALADEPEPAQDRPAEPPGRLQRLTRPLTDRLRRS
jgi:hypothetical protein